MSWVNVPLFRSTVASVARPKWEAFDVMSSIYSGFERMQSIYQYPLRTGPEEAKGTTARHGLCSVYL